MPNYGSIDRRVMVGQVVEAGNGRRHKIVRLLDIKEAKKEARPLVIGMQAAFPNVDLFFYEYEDYNH